MPSTWGLPAIVFRHPSNRKGFAAERVGQEMLQGPYLAPSARLHCLHNTRLEPPHRTVYGIPVDGVPCAVAWESAPVRVATAVICLLSYGGYPNSLVMKDQRDVSPLSREVMCAGLNPYPPHYRMAFAFPPPMPARPWAHLAARFPSREAYGVAMFRLSNSR